MKRKIVGIICVIATVCSLTGCGKKEEGSKAKIKGNCHAVDCIQKIEVENTVEDINKVIGFEGELTDEKYNTYTWKINEDESIVVTYYSGKKGTIVASMNKEDYANKKVDFSKYDELQKKVKAGITYDDFKSFIGNIDGIVVEKSSYNIKYLWVSDDNSYLNATFSNSSNQCTFINGMIK